MLYLCKLVCCCALLFLCKMKIIKSEKLDVIISNVGFLQSLLKWPPTLRQSKIQFLLWLNNSHDLLCSTTKLPALVSCMHPHLNSPTAEAIRSPSAIPRTCQAHSHSKSLHLLCPPAEPRLFSFLLFFNLHVSLGHLLYSLYVSVQMSLYPYVFPDTAI